MEPRAGATKTMALPSPDQDATGGLDPSVGSVSGIPTPPEDGAAASVSPSAPLTSTSIVSPSGEKEIGGPTLEPSVPNAADPRFDTAPVVGSMDSTSTYR